MFAWKTSVPLAGSQNSPELVGQGQEKATLPRSRSSRVKSLKQATLNGNVLLPYSKLKLTERKTEVRDEDALRFDKGAYS